MAEETKEKEKKTEMKNQTKEEKKETNSKPSLWQRMKKPLAAGLLGASLLVTPMKKADALPMGKMISPPIFASDWIEKKYPDGWKKLVEAHNALSIGEGKKAKKLLDEIGDYFMREYEKDKKPEALYLEAHKRYMSTFVPLTFEETELMLKKVLKLIDKRLEEQPNDLDVIHFKLMIYFGAADLYHSAFTNDPFYKDVIDPTKKDFYKKRAIYNYKAFLEFFESVKKRWDKVDIFLFKDEELNKMPIEKVKSEYMDKYERYKKEITEILEEISKD